MRILEAERRNKWKAQGIEPNPGLVDYAESKSLVVPWKDRRAFLRAEEHERALREHTERHTGRKESPVERALQQVFEAASDDVSFDSRVLTDHPDAIQRVPDRAHLTQVKTSPYSYADRHGTAYIAFDEALELGRAFCAAEPNTVLVGVEATEREWSADAGRPGLEYRVGLLNEYWASWAIIRQWAGHNAAIAQREAQVQRLERLVWDAICALQKAGLNSEVQRLRRALGGD